MPARRMPADEKWPAVVEIDDEDEGWKGGGGASPASFSDVEVMTAEEKRAEDDDCCILDCDPSDPVVAVAVVNRKLAFSCCHGGDDIVVIAEKGQVACKDYPHSRHVCVEYPFDGTPHESYCPQVKSNQSFGAPPKPIAMAEEDDKGKVVKLAITKEEEEDDDCYEIDLVEFTRKLMIDSEEDEEEVAIVAEKGPIALRDFPHPRHLCGNFPFNKTSHESHCSKCFCCVCEVAAPCLQWEGSEGHCNISKKASSSPQLCMSSFRPTVFWVDDDY